MTFASFLTSRLESRLRQRRLLTVHDPEGRYREIVSGLVCRTIISYTNQNARVKYAHGPSDSHSFA
jgi:hypothetical protein